jgi:outer membrane protein assembly factor BamE
MRLFFISFCLFLTLLLPACTSTPDGDGSKNSAAQSPSFGIYRALIVQGNVISKEQKDLLRPGLSKTQIREFLGTPLVNSVFHAERWDYVFIYKRQGQLSEPKRLSLFFKDDLIERIESDNLATESEFVAQFGSDRKFSSPPALQATPKQLEKFNAERLASKTDARPSSSLSIPQAKLPLNTYPPLEN